MITMSDEFALVKEWLALERRGRDLEFDRIKFTRKLRLRFGAGSSGDRGFKDWCIAKLRQTEPEADIMLSRAIAGSVFSDANEFRAAGGERALEWFELESKPADREAAMREAKDECRNVRNVWKAKKAPIPPLLPTDRGAWSHRDPERDMQAVAKYLAARANELPEKIRNIIARYVAVNSKRAA